MSSLRQTVRRLAEELRSVEQASRGREEQPTFSTGIAPLDGLLPGGGLRRGMLIEWLPATDEGGGANLLALLTARASADCGMRIAECGLRNEEPISSNSAFRIPHSAFETLVIIDRHGTFYPPAAAAWGIPLTDMILLRPTNVRDEAWALDQALRFSAVAAVLVWPDRLDGRAFRRLQLAAESSGTIGVLVRPASARKEPTWADVRLCVENFGLGTGSRQIPNPKSLHEEIPNSQHGWRLRIQRLHARSCTHQHDTIQIEITPEGQIQEIAPTEHSPTSHNNTKSAI